jgi:hypothetical protein
VASDAKSLGNFLTRWRRIWILENLEIYNFRWSTASATSVPEPFTVLGTIFCAGYGVALKRKLAKDRDKADIS